MSQRTILLATDDAQLSAAVAGAVRKMRGFRVERAGAGGLGRLRATARSCAAVIAEVDPSVPGALEDFHRLARSLPERMVIAVTADASGEDLRRLFRAGAADVVTPPFTADAIGASLAELRRSQVPPPSARGRVVSILKAAGGAGATTLAVNLAGLMAEGDLKRNRPAKRTALLDLDLQFGDADLALDLQAKSGLVDVLRAPERLDGRFLQSVMTEHASGLRLLAAPNTLLPVDALAPDLADSLIELSSTAYERVIVDLPTAWSDWSLRVLAHSDLIVLLAPPTVGGAVGARRALDALKAAGVDRPLLFGLNQLHGVLDALDKPARIGKSLEAPVELSIPADSVAAKAAERGKLVVDCFPKSALAKALRGVADKLEARLETVEPGVDIRAAA